MHSGDSLGARARPLQVECPGALYQVTARGNGRADIVLEDGACPACLDVLATVCHRMRWWCDADWLMSNHDHVEALVNAAEPVRETQRRPCTAPVFALQAQRMASRVTPAEAALLLRLTGRLPEDVPRRAAELRARHDAETLGDEEHTELLQRTKQVEAFDVARVEALSTLASRRGVPRSALMRPWEMASPADA